MPLYEYECENCGERFELLEKFSDEPLRTHAKCGGPVHRLLSAPALQFKGSGWYVTDYAKSQGGSAAENGAPAGKADGAKSAGSEASTSTAASTTASDTKSTKDTKSTSDSKTGTKSGTDTK
jgi:putative FmdB family regulatory protein